MLQIKAILKYPLIMLIITITVCRQTLLSRRLLYCSVPLYGAGRTAGGLLLLHQQLLRESFDRRSSVQMKDTMHFSSIYSLIVHWGTQGQRNLNSQDVRRLGRWKIKNIRPIPYNSTSNCRALGSWRRKKMSFLQPCQKKI